MADERRKGQMSVEEAGHLGGQKGGQEPLRLMAANSAKK